MSYLATRPDSQVYFQPAIDYFSGNGATSQFTLSRPVASVAQIIVSVANVIQNPNTFSVNNNILTLGGNAPVGTNNIWVQYQTAVIQVNQPGQGTVGTSQLMLGAVAQSNLAAGVAGNGPAFSAYQSSAQSISQNTITKVQFQTKLFDTGNSFDATTNYRFQPTIAGYYQVEANVSTSTATITWLEGALYKNGSVYSPSFYRVTTGSMNYPSIGFNSLIYMNGTTDNLEVYVLSVNTAFGIATTGTSFQAFLARSA